MYALMLHSQKISALARALFRSPGRRSSPPRHVPNRLWDLLCNTVDKQMDWVKFPLQIVHGSGGYVLLQKANSGKKWLYVVNPAMKLVKDAISRPSVDDSSNYYNLCHDTAGRRSSYKILWIVRGSDDLSHEVNIYDSETKAWTPVEFTPPTPRFPIPFERGVFHRSIMYWLDMAGGAGVKFNMNITLKAGEQVSAMSLPSGEDRFLFLGKCAENLFLVGCRYEPGIGCAVAGCGCNEVWTVYKLSKDDWLKMYTIGKERFPDRRERVHESGWQHYQIISIVKPASTHITNDLKLVFWYRGQRGEYDTRLVWFDFVTKSVTIRGGTTLGHCATCFPLEEFFEMNAGPAEEDPEVARAQLMLFGSGL